MREGRPSSHVATEVNEKKGRREWWTSRRYSIPCKSGPAASRRQDLSCSALHTPRLDNEMHAEEDSPTYINPLVYRPAMSFGNRKKYFRGSFLFSIVTIKKNQPPPPRNLNFNYLRTFKNLTLDSPKYSEWNLAYEKLQAFFPLKYAILSFGKCLIKFQVSRGVIFFELWQYWTEKIL